MDIHLFNRHKDYNDIKKLWEQRGMVVVPSDILSDYGFVVTKNNNIIGAMWLYPQVTTKWCMLRFPITSNILSAEERNDTLNLLFDTIHKTAKDMGYDHIFIATNHDGLIRRVQNYGYILDSENCSMFWGGL